MIDQVLLSEEVGRRALLLGNEAIVRGAVEAGVAFVSGYPGTPASEIGDTFWRLRAALGIRCEYSINEKVALEVAAGAAQAGVRALVSFKHLGLNVASDALPTLANAGVLSGMVIVTAGDPGAHTSPNEQDHRLLARMARLPMLEPATPEQARQLTLLAFDLSEELGVPVLLRPTTRVSHTRGVVTLGPRRRAVTTGRLVRDPTRFVPLPKNARREMLLNEQRLDRAEELLSAPAWSRIEGDGAVGVISCGVASCYVREAIEDLDAVAEVLHLQVPSTTPLPRKPCLELLERCDRILVVEELLPVLEEQLRSLAVERARRPAIFGKLTGTLPLHGEYGPHLVRPALASLLGRAGAEEAAGPRLAPPTPELPARPPVLCAGCPHRASFAAVRLVFDEEDTAFVNDIGCYSLGFGKPLECADFLLCMGSSITQASGMSTALRPKQTVAFIGDSTFFHSGMTGLLNSVSCGHDLILLILDNGTTAMTGHQPHVGIAEDRGWAGPNASIERIVRSLGVERLWTFDPLDVDEAVGALRQARDARGVRVVIARHPCPVDLRRRGRGAARRRYRIEAERCRHCATRSAGVPCSCEPSRGQSTTRVLRSLYSTVKARSELAPCTAGCPLGVCVPGYTALVGARDWDGALRLVRERNPLPSVCSRVCHAPCEEACVLCGSAEGPLAINALKRSAVTRGELAPPPRPTPSKDRSVAVVGAGPAGLACADELARRGYPVTIYEAAAEPGGLLRYGIPPYRLPRDILDRDIRNVLAGGVELRCGVRLGRDLTLEELLERHAAVFLGLGAWRSERPRLEGADLDGVTDALAFLGSALAEGRPSTAGQRVTVVGGGDSAIDCARTAIRLGATDVTLLYRRGREQMPAEPAEVADALAEGVRLVEWARPLSLLGDERGSLRAVLVQRTEATMAGADGRLAARDAPGPARELETDLLIFAFGQQVDPASLAGGAVSLPLSSHGTVQADELTCATSHPRVWVGGDALSGPATVVGALAAGKLAAHSIDVALSASAEPLPRPLPSHELVGAARSAQPVELPSRGKELRPDQPKRAASARRLDFEEVIGELPPELATREASRCLGCAPCAACDACTSLLGCPAIVLAEDGRPRIDEDACNGCGLCARFCPTGAIVEVLP